MTNQKSVLTKDQVKFYNENGYLIVDNVFTSEDCDSALKIYERYADSDYKGIMNLDRKEPGIKKMVTDPRIVTILETLQGAECSLLQTMFLFKRAGSPYAAQAWNPHQDNSYVQCNWGAYITGNIAFADQDPENGGMYLFPGSHREPILPAVKVKSFHEDPGTNPGHRVEVPDKYQKVDILLKKGAVLWLNANVIHGSYANRSKDRSRPMLLVPYITKGEKFIPGKVAQRMEQPLR